MKKGLALLLAAALSLSILTACNGGNDTSTANKEGYYPGTPTQNSIAVNIGGEPPTLFNILSIDTYSNTVLSHVLDMLVMQDETGAIVPNAAESWEYDKETLTYTFYLKEGPTWSNGDLVTAHDFEYGWKSLLNPEFAATYAYAAYIIENGEEYNNGEVTADEVGVKALDDYTLEVKMARSVPYALSQFCSALFGPVNQKAYEECISKNGADSYGTDADKVVTNGPYQVVEWHHENQIVIEKVENYKGAFDVEIESIIFKMISDSNVAMNEFKTGGIDYLHELTGEQAEMLRQEGAPVIGYETAGITYIDYNYDWPGLDNANIRKGLTMAINTEMLCQNVLKNSSQPAYTIVPGSITELSTGKPFSERVGPQFTYDTAAAVAYFEAGLEEEGLTKENLNLVIICDDKDVAQKTCAYLQEEWKTVLGIDVEISAMPFKSRIQHLIDQDFCMCLDGWTMGYNDPTDMMEIFISTNGNNAAKYLNSEYDALMEKAANEQDENTRYEILAQAEKLLIGEDMGPGPLYYVYKDAIVSEKVENAKISAFQYTWRFASIKDVE